MFNSIYSDDSELKKATAEAEEKFLEASSRLTETLNENAGLNEELSKLHREWIDITLLLQPFSLAR